MDEKERYERESKAKGGTVPPDERRHHKGRSESAKQNMPNEGSSFEKREQAKRDRAKSGELTTVDIEHVSEAEKKAIAKRD